MARSATTRSSRGDFKKALGAIKAKAYVMPGQTEWRWRAPQMDLERIVAGHDSLVTGSVWVTTVEAGQLRSPSNSVALHQAACPGVLQLCA